MTVDLRSGSILAAAWLATLAFAFTLGSRGDGTTRAPGPAAPGIDPAPPTREPRDSRQVSLENRFLEFTRTLDGDELARLLPEMAHKMPLLQTTRLLETLDDETKPGPARRAARFALVERWAQLEPMATMTRVDGLNDPKLRHDLKRQAIAGWASVDPEAALNYIAKAEWLPDGAHEAAWNGFANTRQLPEALKFVEKLMELPYGQPGSRWEMTTAITALYENDEHMVIEWAESLPAGELREQAVASLFDAWSAHDPAAAEAWLDRSPTQAR